MERARQQAQSYARDLPPTEVGDGGRPPFLIVAEVGDSLALCSEFTRSGGNHVPFASPIRPTVVGGRGMAAAVVGGGAVERSG